ncbi:MAG: cytochrome c biogenesis protein ResB, partial [Coriobacteriia bacterium]
MRKLFDILTSRRASIALMIFVAVAGAIGAWVPQRANISVVGFDEWASDNPGLASAYAALGFDRIFSTWWFRAVLAIFLLSLSAATWRMIVSPWRRVRLKPSLPRNPVPNTTADQVVARARAAGYREYSSADGVRVFWRHRLGLWAPAVMHAGMVLAALAAIVASSFTTRAVVDLSVGEVFVPGDRYLVAEGGILGRAPDLGTAMRLDEIAYQEWPNGEIKTVTARISFQDETGAWVSHEGSPNDPLRFQGHILYVQAGEAGEAVFAIVTAPDGTKSPIRLEFGFPDRAKPGYTDMPLEDGTLVRARWDPYELRDPRPLSVRIGEEEG